MRELDSLVSADTFVELHGGGCGGNIEFRAERLDASLVLAERQMVLILAAVAVHEEAMGVFAAVVTCQDELAQRLAGGVLAPIKVNVAQTVERIEIGHAQAFAHQDGPLFVGIVGQQVILV